MTTTLFIRILNMSLGAAWAAIFVICARTILQRFSHACSYALWGVVLFRLVCPVSFSSVLSLMPRQNTIPQEIVYTARPEIESGFAVIDQAVNGVLPAVPPPASIPAVSAAPQAAGVSPMQLWLGAGKLVWQAGMALLLLYGLVSFLRFLGSIRGAMRVEDNIWESDRIPTAFVLGLLRPRIYLPTGLSETERKYVLCHEQTHIRRLDHIVKPVSLLLLTIHWFNPVLWLAYILMRRDMEMSCDERALKELGEQNRKGYSACLLNLSARSSGLAAPLAFGENDVKGRIVNILRYQKPALLATVLSVVLVCVLGFCLLADPREDGPAAVAGPEQDGGIIVLANPGEAGQTPSAQADIPAAPTAGPEQSAAAIIHYTAPVKNSIQQTVHDNHLDYGVDFGAPVYSPIRGTVDELAEHSIWPYGKYVVVRSSENPDIILMMAHLSAIAEGLKVGDEVDSATQIGAAGATGMATGPVVTVAVRQKTDGDLVSIIPDEADENKATVTAKTDDQSAPVPAEEWDAIFDNWRDGISGDPDPDPYDILMPVISFLPKETWASPREIGNWLELFEELYTYENKQGPRESYGDDWPVAVIQETLSRWFEGVTVEDVIESGKVTFSVYDPAAGTIHYSVEKEVLPPLVTSAVKWARVPGEEELFTIDYRQVYSYVGDPEDKAVYGRLTVKLLPDGSFRYLSNLEGQSSKEEAS